MDLKAIEYKELIDKYLKLETDVGLDSISVLHDQREVQAVPHGD